jgi:Helix-loop-helix DNA-binding domain
MRFGSDTNFGGSQGYTIGDQKEMESMERQQQELLKSLEVSKSAASTRPSSPVHGQTLRTPQLKQEVDEGHEAALAVDPQAPPSKRRKSRVIPSGKSPADDGTPSSASAKARKKAATEQKAAAPTTPAGKSAPAGRKRKGAPGGDAKPVRETLTEAEKKENHIKSEQRRRGQIKEGFEDLNKLVPGLQGGGFSKSIQLTHAAEWLLAIRQENEALARHVESLGR